MTQKLRMIMKLALYQKTLLCLFERNLMSEFTFRNVDTPSRCKLEVIKTKN